MKSIVDLIEETLLTGFEYSPFELQDMLKSHSRYHSDSSITMAIRKLRLRGHEVAWRYKEGTRTTLYKIVKKVNLRYCLMTASMQFNENRHAQTVMKELGITYYYATPQSMGDQWWFWNCQNLPNKLPEYLTIADLNPLGCIGWGLNEETANDIIANS